MAIDYASDIGMVRLLIPDTNETYPILTDEQIGAFLSLEGGVVKRAAAAAIETVATNEALVSKVIKSQDLSTDGSKVSLELRLRARELRRQADQDDADTAGDFQIVDFVDPFTRRRC